MIISTRTITEEYYDDTLIISVLETEEIVFLGGGEERGPSKRGPPGAKPVLKIPVYTAF